MYSKSQLIKYKEEFVMTIISTTMKNEILGEIKVLQNDKVINSIPPLGLEMERDKDLLYTLLEEYKADMIVIKEGLYMEGVKLNKAFELKIPKTEGGASIIPCTNDEVEVTMWCQSEEFTGFQRFQYKKLTREPMYLAQFVQDIDIDTDENTIVTTNLVMDYIDTYL